MNSDREMVCEPTTCGDDTGLSRRGQAARCLAIMRGGAVMTPFDIVVVRTGTAAVVQVCGELDMSTAPRLDEQLVSLADEGILDVSVDLADLDFIDSSGLQVLLGGLKRLRKQGGDLGLRSPRQSTRKLLEITGLTSVFRQEAIEHAGFIDASPDQARMPTGDRS